MISIIVPVYNVAPYLPQCLDSLINQTYRDIEIICVNDGSKDDSPIILEEYARKDSRIKVVNQVNQGLSAARNNGFEYAQGEWTMYVDSDDWMDTRCCEALIYAVQDSTDLCVFNYIREFNYSSVPKYIYEKDKKVFDEKNINDLYVRLLAPTGKELAHPDKLDSLSTAWGKLYKTSIIREHQIKFVSTKEIGTEDLLFNVYYFTWIKNAVYLPDAFYHYRKNNITSLTKLYKPRLTEQWGLLFHLIEEWIVPLKREGLEEAFQYRKALCLMGRGLNIVFADKTMKEQKEELASILYSKEYVDVIAVLPLSQLSIPWRLFYGLAKYKQTYGVLWMLKCMKFKLSQ